IRDSALMGANPIRRQLGREFNQFGFKMSSGAYLADPPEGGIPLRGAHLDINVESNPADPNRVVVQLTAKWQRLQIPVDAVQLPAEIRNALSGRNFIELN